MISDRDAAFLVAGLILVVVFGTDLSAVLAAWAL